MARALSLVAPLHRIKTKLPNSMGNHNGTRGKINRIILEQLERNLLIQTDHSLGNLVRPSDIDEPIQRWFKYREGYTTELCRQIFSHDESFIVDPFCGFGSTLLAARKSGIPSAGLDVSPLATFVSRVKTRTYKAKAIKSLQARADKLRSTKSSARKAPAPQLRILNKLFHPEILNALLVFRSAIESVENSEEQEFLLLAWIGHRSNPHNRAAKMA